MEFGYYQRYSYGIREELIRLGGRHLDGCAINKTRQDKTRRKTVAYTKYLLVRYAVILTVHAAKRRLSDCPDIIEQDPDG